MHMKGGTIQKRDFVIKVLAFCCFLAMLTLVVADVLAEPIQTRIVAAHGGLRVRREPSTSSQTVYVLDETTVVVVAGWRDGWALVCNNAPPYLPIGWACGDYLK